MLTVDPSSETHRAVKNVKVGLTLPLEPGTVPARLEPLRVTGLRRGKSPSVARRRSEMLSVASFSSIWT